MRCCFIYCILIITTILIESEGRPSFIDAIPLVSQGKMAFLYIIGKPKQAQQTWNNFKNMTHLWENVKDIDNSIPGYGHVKALIVKLNGDDERAGDIFYASSKSTCIIGGFLLAGPAGALEGSIFSDTAFSLILDKPQGVIEHLINFKQKTASDHVDVVLDLTLAALGPKAGSKTGSFIKNKITQKIEMKKVDNLKLNKQQTLIKSGDELEKSNSEISKTIDTKKQSSMQAQNFEDKISERRGVNNELMISSDAQPKQGILKSTKQNQQLVSSPEKVYIQSISEKEIIKPRIVGRKGVIFTEERNVVYEVERVETEYEIRQREKMMKLAVKLEKYRENERI